MFKASLAGTLLVCMAIGQSPVAMPAHNAIYNGFTRGWNVTAQTDFAITELDLPTDAFQPGDTASFLIKKDGCRWGADCEFCHLCPIGEVKKRKKE